MIVSILIGLALAVAVAWLMLVAMVIAFRPKGRSIGQTARVVPDAARLAVELFRDRSLPRSVRRRLWVALIYNVQPINLIPDVVPVIGFVDNLAVLTWALRGAVRTAGPEAVTRHWRGSPESLAALYRALRLAGSTPAAIHLGETAVGSPSDLRLCSYRR